MSSASSSHLSALTRDVICQTTEEKKEEKKPDDEKRGGFVQAKRTKKQDLLEAVVKTKKVEQEFGPVVDKAIPEHVALAKVTSHFCAHLR